MAPPLVPAATLKQFEQTVHDCTGEYAVSVDWAAFLGITDVINANQHGAKVLMKVVQKRISKCKDAQSQNLALTLLETIVKNCECAHLYAGGSDFQSMLFKLATGKKTPPATRDKIVSLVQVWNHAFQRFDKKRYKFCHTYDQLLKKGVSFPVFSVEDQPPLFTPPPVQQALEDMENEARAIAASTGQPYHGPAAYNDGGDDDDEGSYTGSYYSDDGEGRRDDERYYQQRGPPPAQHPQQSIIYESLPPGVYPSYPVGSPVVQGMPPSSRAALPGGSAPVDREQVHLHQQMLHQQMQLQQQYDQQQQQHHAHAAYPGSAPGGAPGPVRPVVDVEQAANAAELLRDMLSNVDLGQQPGGRLQPDELLDGLHNGLSKHVPGLQQQIAAAMMNESADPDLIQRLLLVNDQATEALNMYRQLRNGEPVTVAPTAAPPSSNANSVRDDDDAGGDGHSGSAGSTAGTGSTLGPKKTGKKTGKARGGKGGRKTSAVQPPAAAAASVDLLGLGDVTDFGATNPLVAASSNPSSAPAGAASSTSTDWLTDVFASPGPASVPSPAAAAAPSINSPNPFLVDANPFADPQPQPAAAAAPPLSPAKPKRTKKKADAKPMQNSTDEFDSFFSGR